VLANEICCYYFTPENISVSTIFAKVSLWSMAFSFQRIFAIAMYLKDILQTRVLPYPCTDADPATTGAAAGADAD
jgi:hypothetical protein